MIEQSNLVALKKLAAKMIGGETSAADIPGNTIADVLEIITENYEGKAPLVLGELTVSSSMGSTDGKTVIAVTPAIGEGHTYRYKTDPSSEELPERNADLSAWASWNGVSEIEAPDGQKIIICEVDANNLAIKGGATTVVSA